MHKNFYELSRSKHSKINNNINITPLVDVMLVLLIIFMVTAPMMIGGVDINLPKTNSKTATQNLKPLIVSINEKGEVFLMKTKIKKSLLAKKLKNIAKEKGSKEVIFVKGDLNTKYDQIIKTIAEIQSAGFERISLISEIEDESA